MKRLIDVAAINAMKAEGKNIVYVDRDTLLTPAARDAISTNGMMLKEGACPVPEMTLSASCCQEQKPVVSAESPKEEVSAELIFKVLSCLQDSGLLKGMLDACSGVCKPYDAEYDPAGFKLIRGGSIKTEVLDTGDPALFPIFCMGAVHGGDYRGGVRHGDRDAARQGRLPGYRHEYPERLFRCQPVHGCAGGAVYFLHQPFRPAGFGDCGDEQLAWQAGRGRGDGHDELRDARHERGGWDRVRDPHWLRGDKGVFCRASVWTCWYCLLRCWIGEKSSWPSA